MRLLRNFFYAVAFVLLAAFYDMSPVDAQFSDLVRLVQSIDAQKLVAVLTTIFVCIDLIFAQTTKGGGNPSQHTHKDEMPDWRDHQRIEP